MAVRLDLHIGYPQTGTTALQSFFTQNAARLAEKGLLYPQTGHLNNAHYRFNFALGLGSYDEDKIEAPEVLRDRLRDEVAGSSCQRVLLSSEYFVLASREDIARIKLLFGDYDMRIVVYLRRHDTALEAAYAQSVKTLGLAEWQSGGIDSFVLYQLTSNNHQYDYLACLRRWAAVLGKDALIVRPYEKTQNQPDLFADFLTAIGVADSPALVRPGQLNPTLNPDYVAAIAALQRAPVPEATKNMVLAALINLGGRETVKRPHLALPMRKALVQRFRPSYRTIAEEFLGESGGVLFKEPLQDQPAGEPAPAIDSRATIDLILKAVALYLH
jgi:hypothetical protein